MRQPARGSALEKQGGPHLLLCCSISGWEGSASLPQGQTSQQCAWAAHSVLFSPFLSHGLLTVAGSVKPQDMSEVGLQQLAYQLPLPLPLRMGDPFHWPPPSPSPGPATGTVPQCPPSALLTGPKVCISTFHSPRSASDFPLLIFALGTRGNI